MRYLNLSMIAVLITLVCSGCGTQSSSNNENQTKSKAPFLWKNASIYFLLTDRFNNGDKSNDNAFNRIKDGAPLRSYEGGDLKGITAKIEEGYFTRLGVSAIWLTPHIEQVKSYTDEGTGKTYAYHGYWAADWTQVDPNLGTMEDMHEFVETAHKHDIRILLDVVINHTGPQTKEDPLWSDEWVRLEPTCKFKTIETTVKCALVEGLPDIKTETNSDVALPPSLVAKWKAEGRYAQEVKELDEFFARTQLPRTPRHYIMKWHLDWIREMGVDGFRVDTAKHTEASIWLELQKLAHEEFETWKAKNPTKKVSDDPFYMTAEIYNYGIQGGQSFNMGPGEDVNFYQNGFDSLINFSLKGDGNKNYEAIFSEYSTLLNEGELKDYSVINYMSSHDDAHPFDPKRERPFETATKLMLSPGAAQIYYGDETARNLIYPGAIGDANLRTNMNWDELAKNTKKNGYRVGDVFEHWAKLGQFRRAHPSVGAGVHRMLSQSPYVFSRTLNHEKINDKVVVALDLSTSQANHVIDVKGAFNNGDTVMDYYSGQEIIIKNNTATLPARYAIVLLGSK